MVKLSTPRIATPLHLIYVCEPLPEVELGHQEPIYVPDQAAAGEHCLATRRAKPGTG